MAERDPKEPASGDESEPIRHHPRKGPSERGERDLRKEEPGFTSEDDFAHDDFHTTVH